MSADKVSYRTDTDVVWCPGCGDFGVMRAIEKALVQLEVPREDIVMISGIGCSSRLPGYFDVYGFNTVHGRALPIAQGVKVARPDLTVVVASGDGDALAIGAGHFVHAGRRNTDITLVLFDNQVYGLTKGQSSPTSPTGDKMRLADYGVAERPMDPVHLAVSLGATFVARGFSGDPKGLQQLIAEAIQHRGFSVVQVLSPCVTFRAPWDPYKTIRDRRTQVPEDHDTSDRLEALHLAEEEGDSIHLGVFYRDRSAPTFGDLMDRIAGTATEQAVPPLEAVLDDFRPRLPEGATR